MDAIEDELTDKKEQRSLPMYGHKKVQLFTILDMKKLTPVKNSTAADEL